MSEAQVRDRLFAVLKRVAPEVNPSSLDPKESLRKQADLDSVDVMNLVVGLHEDLGVDIPETDYEKLETVDAAVSYLTDRLEGGAEAGAEGGAEASPESGATEPGSAGR